MRKFYAFFLVLLLWLPLGLQAQQWVQLGTHRFVPEQNLRRPHRGALDLGQAVGGCHNVLVQFEAIPSGKTMSALQQQGLKLGDYVGGNAYFATVVEGTDVQAYRKAGLVSLIPVRAEWKLSPQLEGGRVPSHAKVTEGTARVDITFASNVTPQEAQSALQRLGCTEVSVSDIFACARVVTQCDRLEALLALPWVLRVEPIEPPYSTNNYSGRTLGRASVLSIPATLGGRGLRGRGSRVGVWDGNAVTHPDFGDRVHVQEYEASVEAADHGTHVTGTVLGAGMQDPDGMGMAPEAHAWTYNFNRGRNGLSEPEEMKNAAKQFGITLTQNSYGLYLSNVCGLYKDIVYSLADFQRDRLACDVPTLSHVFAAGNDQASCPSVVTEEYGKPGYGTVTIRAKNMIYVAAVNERGTITNFSSMGPQDDGRLFPIVSAKGESVYSVRPVSGYQRLSGTSMACPTTTGHLALLQERYRQVNSGANVRNDVLKAIVANTANEAGRKGPDFTYGYGILDAEKAVQAIENEYYLTGELAHGAKATHSIQVPAWATGLKVMLLWNDPPISKPVEWGQSVLVNDLDLSVNAGGTDWAPWVLNPTKDHVEDLPERKVDRLNNIEQVTLSSAELNGAQKVEVNIGAHRVANGAQRYALTWWFEQSDMRMLYPAAGEVLEPEMAYVARLENPPASYDIELSYDGGMTYKRIARIASGDANPLFKVPADAPACSKAVLRIVDAQGHFAASQGVFTIAAQPKNLQLKTGECGYDGWSLTWDQVPSATHGYEILLGDASTGTWKSIGHTDGPQTAKFELTGDEILRMVKEAGRPLFAVATRTPEGQWGKRSIARMADLSAQLGPAPADLPIVETFMRLPSPLFRTKSGKNVKVQYVPQKIGDAPEGSNYLGLVIKDRLKDFDESDYFGAKNADNAAELFMCEVDLTGHGTTVLHITGGLIPSNSRKPETAQMRVLSNDKPLKSQYGGEVQMFKKGVDDWYFTLEEGKHTIRIQFVGKEVNDLFAISRIAIEPVRKERDVMLTVLERPEDGKNLGVSPIKLRVTNKNFQPVKGVEVRGYVNGKWQTAAKVEELAGFADTEVTLSLDLSTRAAIGEVMNITVKAQLDGDVNPKDNEVSGKVINMGSLVTMPRSVVSNGSFGQQVIDPRETIEITKPVIFTDDGGYFGTHATRQSATLKIRPKDPTMRVRVTFKEFVTEKDEAVLGVYTATVPPTLQYTGIRVRDLLTGTMQGTRTYVSEAEDGAITFVFASRQSSEKGWVAEVDLVPAQNPLTLVSAKAQALGTDPMGKVPVEVTLRNNWQQPLKNVSVVVWDGKREILTWERLQTLAPGESTVTLKEPFEMPFATNAAYEVYVEGDDSDGSDNVLPLLAAYDRYCQPGAVSATNKLALYYLSVAGQEFEPPAPNGRLQYLRLPKITLFKKDGKVDVHGELDYNDTPEDATLSMWVDWDDDGKFTDAERTEIVIAKGKMTFRGQLDVPATAVAGERRVRISLTKAAESKEGPCFDKGLAVGALLDVVFVVKEGTDPLRGDLRLKRVDAGKPGVKLPADRQVKIVVDNRSNALYDGKVKVRLTVDNMPAQEEEIACTIKKQDSATLTLTKTADLSAQGQHVVKVEIEELPAVVNPENNTAEARVYNVIPQEAERYALQMASGTKRGRYISTAEVGDAMAVKTQHSNRTIEMMVNFDRPQAARLISATGFHLMSFYGQGGLPDNGLGVVIGLNHYVVTSTPVIKPGTWQHVAVVIHDIVIDRVNGSTCWVEIFVDGVKQSVLVSGLSAPSFTDLKLAPRFDGKLDVLRTWTSLRSQDELQANRYKYLREASGKLPQNCVAEYAFDEGPRNAMAYSGPHAAQIQVEDPTLIEKDDNTGVWYKIGELISRFDFAGQVRQSDPEQAGEPYKILFPHGTDLSQVTGNVIPIWPETQLSYDGKPITQDTKYDFSGGKTVTITAERKGLYGKDYTQTVRVVAELDKDNANTLLSLSLEKAKNPGLLTDVQPKAIAPLMELDMPEAAGRLNDITQVKLTFTVPASAKAFAQGKELASGETPVDLTDPVTITVKAANGEARAYVVRLAYAQEIEWTLEKTEYTYGDQPVPLVAKASSGLPVIFTSDNAEVASEAQGALRIARPGAATISAHQAGGKHFAAAKQVDKAVHVAKRPVTVKPNVHTTFGVSSPWTYEYSNLVNEDDARSFPDPMRHGVFSLTKLDGTPVTYSEALPVGEYKLVADAAKAYENELYTFTPEDGSLIVEQGNYRSLVVYVVDGAGQPLEGVTVNVGAKSYLTGQDGVAHAICQEKTELEWVATKGGYSKESGRISIPEGKDGELRVVLRSAQIELSYAAGEHGFLAGMTSQRVAKGASGEPVLALADEGYMFSKWNDGVTENPRVDRNVTEAVNVSAIFSPITYSVEYVLGEGGKLVSGSLKQQVPRGADGSPVEVAPASQDYYLEGWSDGQHGATHTVKNVQGDMRIEARFAKFHTLPDVMDFERGTLEDGWYTVGEGNQTNRFVITDKAPDRAGKWRLDGKFALCNSGNLSPYGPLTITYLYTPRYKVDGADKDLVVAFDYLFNRRDGDQLILEYSLDGAAFVEAKNLQRMVQPKRTTEIVKIDKDKLTGHQDIQFRWTYKARKGYYTLIDNIAMYWDEASVHVLSYEALPSEGGTITLDGAPVASQNVNRGAQAKPVVATPNADFKFVEWRQQGSVLGTDPKLTLGGVVAKNATYTALFRHVQLAHLTYKAIPAVGGTFKVGDVEAQEQDVTKGEDAKPVTAVPQNGYRFVRWNNTGSTDPILKTKADADAEYVAIFELRQYTLSFAVKSQGTPVQQAQINVGTKVERTDDQGALSVSVVPGEYAFTVIADGYEPYSGTATVSGDDVQVSVELVKKQTNVAQGSTFVVTHEGAPVAGAIIEVNAHKLTTDASGSATVLLAPRNSYQYTVTAEGFAPASGVLELDNEPKTVNVALQRITYTVTWSMPEHGAITVTAASRSLANGDAVVQGSEISVEVKPEGGYKLAKLLVNGEDRTADAAQGVLTLTVSANVTLEATFAPVPQGEKPTPRPPTEVEDGIFAQVVAFPNPFVNNIRVRGLQGTGQIRLLDVTAAVILTTPFVNGHDVILQLADLPAGVYLLVIDNGRASRTIRLVKQ